MNTKNSTQKHYDYEIVIQINDLSSQYFLLRSFSMYKKQRESQWYLVYVFPSKSNLPFSSTRSDFALKCGSVTNCGGAATALRNVQHLCKKVAVFEFFEVLILLLMVMV